MVVVMNTSASVNGYLSGAVSWESTSSTWKICRRLVSPWWREQRRVLQPSGEEAGIRALLSRVGAREGADLLACALHVRPLPPTLIFERLGCCACIRAVAPLVATRIRHSARKAQRHDWAGKQQYVFAYQKHSCRRAYAKTWRQSGCAAVAAANAGR